MAKLTKKIKYTTTITLVTGLHIGGNSENVEIGGIDNPVIKIATKNNQPYIPGSSLKGKMRCLLEQVAGATEVGGSAEVNKLFGAMEKKNVSTACHSKIIVRDAFLTPEAEELLHDSDGLDMPYTENKFENVIDRVTGTTVKGGIRQTERVPAGAVFNAEFIINVWDEDVDGKALEDMFKKGIKLLENDYIGGSGSRGYGQIKFGEFNKVELSEDNNWGA
ncbi:MAG: type III-A CRISPR-associated RAMP protein Csm3 [Bacteroidaceae bacterium]|nr:type III-A CRISPR-associated RAMP protein Csm3 [Bacteroidaceae bacterium]